MKFEKMSMKVLSVFMSLIMLFSVCAPVISAVEINAPTTAAEKDKLVYVSIGDSMTNGYGLDGYNGNSGIMNYAKNTYSNKFAAWLAGYTGKIENDQVIFDGPFATVDHRQLAMSGMRAEDLHWLLKLDYENSEFMETIYNQWYSPNNSWEEVVKDLWFGEWGFKVGDFRTWSDLCDGDYRYADGAARILATYGKDENKGFFQSSFAGEKEIQNAIKGVGKKQYYPTNKTECEQIGGYRYLQIATEFYQKSVEDADIISLALGNTNFGTFMFAAIVEILSGPESELEIFRNRYDVEDVFALADLDPALEQKIRDFIPQIEDYVHEKFGSLTGGEKERMDALTNIILYCFSSYLVNYIGVVNEILAVNPDVQIIQVALMNAYADEVEGITETTLGDVVDFMYEPLNAFIAGLPTAMKATGDPLYADAHFYYAETDSVECMVHVFGDDYYYKDETKEEFTGYLGFDVSKTEGIVANVDSVARDRFFAYIKGSLLAPLGGSLGLSNLDGLTLAAIFEYEQMTNAEKAAFAAVDKDTAMACAFYLAFENALIKAGRGIVTLNSLVMSAEIYDTKNFSVLSPVLVQFKEQIVNTAPAYAKDVAEAMAPIVAKTVADTINGMLAGFGVKIELTVTQQDVLKIMTDGKAGTQTKAVCEAIAEQARLAVIEAVLPVYVKGHTETLYPNVKNAISALAYATGVTTPTPALAAAYFNALVPGFDPNTTDISKQKDLILAFYEDVQNGYAKLKAINPALNDTVWATILGENNPTVGAMKLKAMVDAAAVLANDALAAKATENYIDGKLGDVTLKDNLLNQISAAMPKRVKDSASSLCTLLAVPETLSAVMTADEESPICSLLCMASRVLIGDGIGGHPSEGGHVNLYDAIHDSYVNDYTSVDETTKNLAVLRDLFLENYEEIYAALYKKAYDAGKIDEIVSYLADAKAFITFAKDFVLEYEEYFRGDDVKPQIEALAENANNTIDAAISLVTKADALDAEIYAAFMKLLEALNANLADIASLVKIVAEDAYIYADEYVQENIIPAVLEQLALLNTKILETIEALEAASTKLQSIVSDLASRLERAVKAFLEKDVFHADYTASKDSFLLAIGDDTYYSEVLAEKLGLNESQYGTMDRNAMDSSVIAKADLITIGFNESEINHFAIDQLIGYVKEYINVDLKNEAETYVKDALTHFFGQMTPALNANTADAIIKNVQGIVTEKIDVIAGNIDLVSDASKAELDWAGLVGEENAKAIEGVIDAIVAGILKTDISEALVYDVKVIEILEENLGELDPSLSALLSVFSTEEIKAMLGDYASYKLELPVVEAVAFIVESYIYSYVKFNIEYAQTVYAINAINPDAKIVLLGGYDAFDGIGLEVTIGEIAVDLAQFLTVEVKAEIDSAFDFIYGEFENGIDSVINDQNIDCALTVLDALLAGIEDAIAFNPTVDIATAIKSFELTDEMLTKLVGEENLPIAQRVIRSAKFFLTETDLKEVVPTAEEFLFAIAEFEDMLQSGLVDLDAIADGYLAELGCTVGELAEIVADLADYADMLKNDVQGMKDAIDSIFEDIKNTDLVFDETVIDLGEIFGDVISGSASVHAILFAHSMENVIYVDIADAETIYDAMNEGEILDFVFSYVLDATVTNLSDAGHEYVAEQIYNALNVTCDHYDDDNDHYCDNLVCDEKLSDCADNTKDHKCDLCGKELTTCADGDKDHKCDYCGAEISKCADGNKDHKCDVCGKELSTCADGDKDHKCDVCGKELSTCADADNDHKCDLCGKELTTCADADNDHKCDLCGKELTTCADENKDHNCDLCGNKLSDCADNDNDHNCDVCGAKLTDCVDNDKDGKCDICGAKLGLSRAAVIGIVAGSVVLAGGAGFAIYWFIIRKKLMKV